MRVAGACCDVCMFLSQPVLWWLVSKLCVMRLYLWRLYCQRHEASSVVRPCSQLQHQRGNSKAFDA